MTLEELAALGLDEAQAGAVMEAWQSHEQTIMGAPVRFTAPMGETAPATKDEIMSIPDKALRRAAIVENMKLFKGD